MKLTECQKRTFENIFLNRPSSKDIFRLTNEFASMFGSKFSDNEIAAAIESLISSELILKVTRELVSTILKELSDVHGPLIAIPSFPHFSVTSTGGRAWFNLLSNQGHPIKRDYESLAVEYVQLFSPSRHLMERLDNEFFGDTLKITDAILAPNNESQDGFGFDLFATPDASVRLAEFEHECTTLLGSHLEAHVDHVNQEIDGHLTHDELFDLFKLSGFCGSSAFQSVCESNALLALGLVCELQKEQVFQLTNRFSRSQPRVFGPMPRTKKQVLSDAGREVIVTLLRNAPELGNYLVASRVIGTYVQRYFPNEEGAIEAQSVLEKERIRTSEIERIGSWCDYWWDVRPEGSRFSYWKFASSVDFT